MSLDKTIIYVFFRVNYIVYMIEKYYKQCYVEDVTNTYWIFLLGQNIILGGSKLYVI